MSGVESPSSMFSWPGLVANVRGSLISKAICSSAGRAMLPLNWQLLNFGVVIEWPALACFR